MAYGIGSPGEIPRILSGVVGVVSLGALYTIYKRPYPHGYATAPA